MFENLKHLYGAYGGWSELLRSTYLRLALCLTVLSLLDTTSLRWVEVSMSILPTLSGFTIAAFALVFAVLPDKAKIVLSKRNGALYSPLVRTGAVIMHGLVIQICAILLAVIFELQAIEPILDYVSSCKCLDGLPNLIFVGRLVLGVLGLFLTIYGLFLVLASGLSVFRLVLIVSNSSK